MIFTTRNRKMLLIFHIDEHGYDLSKRLLMSKSRFRIMLEEESMSEPISREELRRLVLYGSCEEDYDFLKWQNQELKHRLSELGQEATL